MNTHCLGGMLEEVAGTKQPAGLGIDENRRPKWALS